MATLSERGKVPAALSLAGDLLSLADEADRFVVDAARWGVSLATYAGDDSAERELDALERLWSLARRVDVRWRVEVSVDASGTAHVTLEADVLDIPVRLVTLCKPSESAVA